MTPRPARSRLPRAALSRYFTYMRHVIACSLLGALLAACGARSELITQRDWALVCPLGAFATMVNHPVELRVTASPEARGRLHWEVASMPAGPPPMLSAMGDLTARFVASTEGPYDVRVWVEGAPVRPDAGDAREDPNSCLLRVNVRARGPQVSCPPDVTIRPLETASLTARVEGDREVTFREWSVLSYPAASARPTPMPVDRESTGLRTDVAGDYTLRFVARDRAGEEGSCTVTVHAVPTEALRVEMFWNPPPDPSDESDVDLHLLRGGGSRWVSSDDCYYANCVHGNLEWDAPGPEDNPRLDIDDVDGFGPENINLDRAGSAWYRVGVHMFNGDNRPSAQVHVVIYCNGTRVREFGPVTLFDRGSISSNDFWLVADVVMRPSGCEVRPIERGGMPWIFRQEDAWASIGPPPPLP